MFDSECVPAMPLGKVPVLEEDGKKIHQFLSICRYLSKKAGLGGKNDWEDLQIDVIADTITDMRMAIYPYLQETDEAKKEVLKETFLTETMPFYLKRFDEIAKETGFLANNKLSWADFFFLSIYQSMTDGLGRPNVILDFPSLCRLRDSVLNIPQIKEWIAKRPYSEF